MAGDNKALNRPAQYQKPGSVDSPTRTIALTSVYMAGDDEALNRPAPAHELGAPRTEESQSHLRATYRLIGKATDISSEITSRLRAVPDHFYGPG